MEVSLVVELEPSQYLLEAEGGVIRDNLPLDIVFPRRGRRPVTVHTVCSRKGVRTC